MDSERLSASDGPRALTSKARKTKHLVFNCLRIMDTIIVYKCQEIIPPYDYQCIKQREWRRNNIDSCFFSPSKLKTSSWWIIITKKLLLSRSQFGNGCCWRCYERGNTDYLEGLLIRQTMIGWRSNLKIYKKEHSSSMLSGNMCVWGLKKNSSKN